MTVFYCRQFTLYWIIDYFIFLPLQLILEVILAYFMWKRRKSQVSEISLKVVPEKVRLKVLMKEGEISSLEQNYQSIAIEKPCFEQKIHSIGNDKIVEDASNDVGVSWIS
ncbi:hypothetical protein SteCoe_40543 [Stentor coeruleus]|uniref:Uncharacterized protein n=1 Tax=Stentor coeruleus TaxID=5963 RepID=A0A1R2AKG1_9CILI|nr:hypothetical protein SteCoe_40543 [Stentor coeruleus]